MKNRHLPLIAVAGLLLGQLWAAGAARPALPEPGLFLHGSVTSTSLPDQLSITATAGTNSITVPAVLIDVDGARTYFVRVPFESALLPLTHGGQLNLSPSPDRLAVSGADQSIKIEASIDGAAAVFAGGATNAYWVNLPAGFRARALAVPLSAPATTDPGFADWARQYFGNQPVDPAADSDGDGASNEAEYHAGTHPLQASDVFRLSWRRLTDGRWEVYWRSRQQRSYRIERRSKLRGIPAILTELPVAETGQQEWRYTFAPAELSDGQLRVIRIRSTAP